MHNNSKIGKWIFAVLAAAGAVVVLANVVVDNMPKGEPQEVEGYEPWEEETVEMVKELPLQDGGRVKPFSTYAGFRMLALHGARSMKVVGEGDETYKLEPTEWLMDTVFRPWLAADMPTFRVDNSKVIEAIGVETKGRRDRYSYNEIAPGLEKLFDLAKSYEAIEEDDRDPVQQQTIVLTRNVRSYQMLLGYFGFARFGIEMTGTGENGAPDRRTDFSTVMRMAPELRGQIQRMERGEGEMSPGMKNLLQQVLDGANFSRYGLFILPPEQASHEDWLSAGNAIMSVMSMESGEPEMAVEDIRMQERVVRSVTAGEKEFREAFADFKERVEKRAESRGELNEVSLEVTYFEKDFFLNALVLFLIGSVGALAMWGLGATGASKGAYWFTLAATGAGLVLCVIAIVMRSMIMNRSPIGNLYDTIVFIAATGVLFSLLIEWMTRKRFALGLAPILGTALVLLARRYEMGDASDHLDPLVAVLNSNFWLSTHVVTVTLGYSAGLLAALLSCGYVLMRGLNLDGNNKDLRRSLTKAVYGCICLTVFLSLVGTVLGGVWANYSWGRFWGWDPKENGALMIVLWTLGILHARMGGIIKDWGIHLASLFTACIVAFSWWHVNFLGVGLHNYGFTAGKETIWIFYGVMVGFILFGIGMMFYEKHSKRLAKLRSGHEEVRALEA